MATREKIGAEVLPDTRLSYASEQPADYSTPDYKPKAYRRYKSMVAIDGTRLGEELMELPTLIMDVGEITAVLVSQREMAVNFLKERMAVAAEQLRGATRENGKSPPETQVASEVLKHKWVISATIDLEHVKRNLALWQSLMDAAKAKASALKSVTELTVSGYLSPNSVNNQRRLEVAQQRRPVKESRDG